MPRTLLALSLALILAATPALAEECDPLDLYGQTLRGSQINNNDGDRFNYSIRIKSIGFLSMTAGTYSGEAEVTAGGISSSRTFTIEGTSLIATIKSRSHNNHFRTDTLQLSCERGVIVANGNFTYRNGSQRITGRIINARGSVNLASD